MQMNQAQTTHSFATDIAETAFDSVWGNALQREDFLALAAGVRQFSLEMTDLAFVSSAGAFPVEHARVVAD